MIDLTTLELKSRFELLAMCRENGLAWANTDKKVELLARLREHAISIPPKHPKDKDAAAEEKPKKKAAPNNTEDDVLSAVQPFMAKGLKVSFSGGCWHFSCRGAEESGTMRQPLEVIKRCAEMVSKGARHPRKIKDGAMAGALMGGTAA